MLVILAVIGLACADLHRMHKPSRQPRRCRKQLVQSLMIVAALQRDTKLTRSGNVQSLHGRTVSTSAGVPMWPVRRNFEHRGL